MQFVIVEHMDGKNMVIGKSQNCNFLSFLKVNLKHANDSRRHLSDRKFASLYMLSILRNFMIVPVPSKFWAFMCI